MITRSAPVAIVLVVVLVACEGRDAVEACNTDADCNNGVACINGGCIGAREGEGEGEGDGGEGEGEGDVVGEGEGDNRPPTISAPSLRVRNDGEAGVVDVTVGDPDGDSVTISSAAIPLHGILLKGPGGLLYTADAGYVGDDSFTLRAHDSANATADVVVAVRVLPADWLDLSLLARSRVDFIEVAAGTIAQNVPVLVALNADVDPTFVDAARNRAIFVDADGALLPAELDHDDVTAPTFWVLVPEVDASPDSDDHFFVYAEGSSTIVTPPARDVWSDYEGVWHLESDLVDSTGKHAPGVLVGEAAMSTACTIGACIDVDNGGHMRIGVDLLDVAGVAGCTLSATLSPGSNFVIGNVLTWSEGGAPDARVFLAMEAGNRVSAGGRFDDGTDVDSAIGVNVAADVFTVADGVVDVAAGTIDVYQAGGKTGVATCSALGALPATPSDEARIGAGVGVFPFHGRIDEARVSRVRRSDTFVFVDFLSRSSQLVTVAAPER